MMKTWLIRRVVRRPVADAVTACISSSVCRLPFISSSPFASRISLTPESRRIVAVRRVDDFETADVDIVPARCVADLALRPDQDRDDDAGFRGLGGAAERSLVARMDDDRSRRWHLLGVAQSGGRIWHASARGQPLGNLP